MFAMYSEMPSKTVLVIDASIWIDLCRSDIVYKIKLLPYQLEMTDLVWNEVLEQDQVELEGLRISPTEFSAEEVDEIYMMHSARRTLSPADCSNLVLAQKLVQKKRVVFLAVHDSALRKEAVNLGIACKDGLDLLDEMVGAGVIEVGGACEYLPGLSRGRPEVVIARTTALLEKWHKKA